jgi:OmpA family
MLDPPVDVAGVHPGEDAWPPTLGSATPPPRASTTPAPSDIRTRPSAVGTIPLTTATSWSSSELAWRRTRISPRPGGVGVGHGDQFQPVEPAGRAQYDTRHPRPRSGSERPPSIERVADVLARHGTSQVRVAGYGDAAGSHSYNRELSLARADSVRDALEVYGAGPGSGEAEPRASNGSEAGRAAKRRVEILVDSTARAGDPHPASSGPGTGSARWKTGSRRAERGSEACAWWSAAAA